MAAYFDGRLIGHLAATFIKPCRNFGNLSVNVIFFYSAREVAARWQALWNRGLTPRLEESVNLWSTTKLWPFVFTRLKMALSITTVLSSNLHMD